MFFRIKMNFTQLISPTWKNSLILIIGFSALAVSARGESEWSGEAVDGGFLFRQIRYAEAPDGFRRWHSTPVETKKIQRKNPVYCPQIMEGLGKKPAMAEDCLYLNLWAPKKQEKKKFPVVVYFHGGGFRSGSGLSPSYNGTAFLRRELILVTPNYRLGPLGYFYSPSLWMEPRAFGLLDQANALRWVQENIEQFGGDPENIYLMGHSAGASSSYFLIDSGLAPSSVKGAILLSPGRLHERSDQVSNIWPDNILQNIYYLLPWQFLYSRFLSRSAGAKFFLNYDNPPLNPWPGKRILLSTIECEEPRADEFVKGSMRLGESLRLAKADVSAVVHRLSRKIHGSELYPIFFETPVEQEFLDYMAQWIHHPTKKPAPLRKKRSGEFVYSSDKLQDECLLSQ